MGIESVSADLARLIGEWFHDDDSLRTLALAAYQQVRPLDESELALMAAFEAAGDLLIAGHWLSWHYLEHRRFDSADEVEARSYAGAAPPGAAGGSDAAERVGGLTGCCKLHRSAVQWRDRSRRASLVGRFGQQPLGFFLVDAHALNRLGGPVWGSIEISAPFSRGSPVATSK